jgi:hypothetical protein
MSEEQINVKIVQTVEKFPVIYDYSSPGHSNKEEVDKAWLLGTFDNKTGISPDRAKTYAPC